MKYQDEQLKQAFEEVYTKVTICSVIYVPFTHVFNVKNAAKI